MSRENYFIYTRDKKGNKTGHTICVMIKDGMIFHGIANCSKEDQFNYKEGRKLAQERAMKAYERHKERNE